MGLVAHCGCPRAHPPRRCHIASLFGPKKFKLQKKWFQHRSSGVRSHLWPKALASSLPCAGAASEASESPPPSQALVPRTKQRCHSTIGEHFQRQSSGSPTLCLYSLPCYWATYTYACGLSSSVPCGQVRDGWFREGTGYLSGIQEEYAARLGVVPLHILAYFDSTEYELLVNL